MAAAGDVARRMRGTHAYFNSPETCTVLRRELRNSRPTIVFEDGSVVSVATAKALRSLIEESSADWLTRQREREGRTA